MRAGAAVSLDNRILVFPESSQGKEFFQAKAKGYTQITL